METGENCTTFKKEIESKKYSNAFINEYTSQLIIENECQPEILDLLDHYRPEGTDIMSIKSYPILQSILESNEHTQIIKDFIYKSSYLNDCDLLENYSQNKLKYLSKIIFESQTISDSSNSQNNTDCEEKNFQNLKKYYYEK